MRHGNTGKQLSRNTSHRKALRRNMAASLFQHGKIRTTEPKAKELRRFVEKLITRARLGTLTARRAVIAELGHDRALFDNDGDEMDRTLVQTLMDDIAPRYADRPGGYTRIIHLADYRIGDAGREVILQLVPADSPAREDAKGTSRRRRRATKLRAAAGAATRAAAAAEGAKGEERAQAQAAAEAEAPVADQAAEGQPPAEPQEKKD
jgi:large subunit ribosomal protein L17